MLVCLLYFVGEFLQMYVTSAQSLSFASDGDDSE